VATIGLFVHFITFCPISCDVIFCKDTFRYRGFIVALDLWRRSSERLLKPYLFDALILGSIYLVNKFEAKQEYVGTIYINKKSLRSKFLEGKNKVWHDYL